MLDVAALFGAARRRLTASPSIGSIRAKLSVVVALLVTAIGATWTAIAAWRCTFGIFGRDQGIFQYVAWAISHGDRDYVDFREINGPLPHLWHLAFDHLGGSDEHVFRLLDLATSVVVFAIAGAFLPGIGRRRSDPRPWPGRGERAAWALAGAVVLTSQYVSFGWWETAQRESLYDLLLLLSTGLLLHALRPAPITRRTQVLLLGAAGALSALTWFGKPTCLIYSVVQAGLVLLDDEATGTPRGRFAPFALGCAGMSVAMVGVVVAIGDVGSYVRIVFGEVPRLYRYIFSRSMAECYVAYGNGPKMNLAVATLVLAVAGWAIFRPPRRALLVLALLVCGLLLFFVQKKGFPYHLHPVMAGAHLAWLAGAAWCADSATLSARPAPLVGALTLAGFIGVAAHLEARESAAAKSRWDLAGATARLRDEKAYFDQFPPGDFFPWDLRRAAAFLRDVTRPEDRVQTYGMDPYLLYLARRKCATPYIYSFELNVDAALQGGSGGKPSEADRVWLVDKARQHESEMVAMLKERPPAAFALLDNAPFTFPKDAVVDFDQHCPDAAAFMHAGYVPAAQFGAVHIWLRKDVATSGPGI